MANSIDLKLHERVQLQNHYYTGDERFHALNFLYFLQKVVLPYDEYFVWSTPTIVTNQPGVLTTYYP